MRNSILSLGKILNKTEQKAIKGGGGQCYNLGNPCNGHWECGSQYCDLRCEYYPADGYTCVPA